MTNEQQQALKGICDAIVETVKAMPLGCPAGELYARLMAHGCTLDQFENLMGALVNIRMLRKSGHLYFAV